MIEEEGPILGINDVNSDIVQKQSCFEKQKKIILISIGILLLILIFIIIIIIIVNIDKDKNNNSDSNNDDNNNVKNRKIGKIECIYDIDTTNEFINILNEEFSQQSDIELEIEGNSEKFVKKYKFKKIGENKITYIFYDKINMDNMFKDVSKLYSVKMFSEDNAEILSLEQTFQNCEKLEFF